MSKIKSARAFLDSIGANSSISRRGESLERTIECVKYTGIRWFRSGYEGDIPTEDQLAVYRATGAKFSYGLASGGNDVDRLIEGAEVFAKAGALLSLEGNNEPNNWSVTFEGVEGGRDLSWLPVARIQAALYAAVKANPVLKDYPVFGIGGESGAQMDNAGLQYLTVPEDTDCLMPAGTVFCDYANVHNYFCHPSVGKLIDNLTWYAADPTLETVPNNGGHFDNFYGNFGVGWGGCKVKGYSKEELMTLRRVTTETGVTIGTFDGEVDEEMHGRLIVSMYLAQIAWDYAYTALYILRDRTDEDGNQTFGLYAPDYTPRKAAIYLHNLTTILADDGEGCQCSCPCPEYTIAEQSETIHDMMLRKSDASLWLVLWSEKFTGGSENVRVDFASAHKTLELYNVAEGTEPVKCYIDADSIELAMGCNPYVIKLG